MELAFFSVFGSGLVSFFVSWAWAVTRPRTTLSAQNGTAIFISPQSIPSDAPNVTLGILSPRVPRRHSNRGKLSCQAGSPLPVAECQPLLTRFPKRPKPGKADFRPSAASLVHIAGLGGERRRLRESKSSLRCASGECTASVRRLSNEFPRRAQSVLLLQQRSPRGVLIVDNSLPDNPKYRHPRCPNGCLQ